jgi:peptidoglycan/xylan/chitin deacetylase (PgdA/CDA1 family)
MHLKSIWALFLLGAILISAQCASAATNLSKGAVCITDDDGDRYTCQEIMRLASKYKVQATLGIVVQPVVNEDWDIVTWDMLRAGLAEGFLQVASHSMTHPKFLTTISAKDLEWEVGESKKTLAKELGTGIDTFIYPYGEYDQRVIDAVRKHYRFARRAWPSDNDIPWNSPPYNFLELEAKGVYQTTSTEDVKSWIVEAKAKKKLLILIFHKLVAGATADDYEYNIDKYEQIIQYLAESGIPTPTLSEAVRPDITAAISLLLNKDE